MITTPRTLGTVRSYADLHAIMRARAEELKASRLMIDHLARVPDGYASKVLAPRPIRYLGAGSTFPMLSALGLGLVIVEDIEALERIRVQLVPRQERSVRAPNASTVLPPKVVARHGTLRWSQQMNARRSAVLSQAKRRKIARQAARARWAKQENVG